jgi:subtilisin family serine protease
MKKQLFFCSAIVLFTLLSFSGSVITNEQVNKSRFVKDHFILKLKKDNVLHAAGLNSSISDIRDHKTIQEIADNLRLQIKDIRKLFPAKLRLSKTYDDFEMWSYYKVSIDRYRDILSLCEAFEKNKNVDYAEPDFVGEAAGEKSSSIEFKPNDEFFSRQWGLNNDGSATTSRGRPGKVGADINAIKGWDIETGSEDVIVAILDSGVKLNHPDLSSRIWVNQKESKNGIDDDDNGYVDDIYGWNFAYENSNVSDDGGHGTNIAGTIGANTNNSIGYAGVDQKCKLMICKDLDNDNLGEYSWWSSALYYAANNGAKVINMSEGGYDYSKTLNTAIDFAHNAGCIIVASMMNKNNGDNYYPASFRNVLAVGATDVDDCRCKQFTWGGGSNWGKHIAVIAPGNRIYGLDYKDNYNFDVYWSGTSQATAITSGLASLLWGQDRSRTNIEIKEIITSTAKDLVGDPREDTPAWDEFYGYGRIDMYEALTYGKIPSNKIENKNDERDKDKGDINNAGDRQAKALDRNRDRGDDSDSKKARRGEH